MYLISYKMSFIKEALNQGTLGQIFILEGEKVNQKITYLGNEKLEDGVFNCSR